MRSEKSAIAERLLGIVEKQAGQITKQRMEIDDLVSRNRFTFARLTAAENRIAALDGGDDAAIAWAKMTAEIGSGG